MKCYGTLYWITGLSGAGKTTIGSKLYYELRKKQDNVVFLDGDALKNIVSGETLGYTEEDRRKKGHKYAQICKLLTDQGVTVICSTIAMFDEVRAWNRKHIHSYVEVYLEVPIEILRKRDQKGLYSRILKGENIELPGVNMKAEFPKNPDIRILNDGSFSVKKCVERILRYKVAQKIDYDRDMAYWNEYYSSKKGDVLVPSLFAQCVEKKLKERGALLELGCGNGRDSLFFARKGINVTAIDASEVAIRNLLSANKGANITFLCGDFVKLPALQKLRYEYCYSRFSLHAISEVQENELLENVYGCLKKDGKFFIEARSIHDDIFGKGTMVERNAYIYNEHYRRFLDKDEIVEKLIDVGFSVEYAEESRDFAPWKEDNPIVLRVVAKK